MRQALLLLADSRLPAGGHAHSGGLAAAVEAGLVHDLAGTVAFLRGRLHTAGALAAAVAARAAGLAATGASAASASAWTGLDRDVDARTPSPAQRAASRAQGRSLLRVARRAWPHPVVEVLGVRPHHPVVLGVATMAGGGTPADAAGLAASQAVTGPASAALRLLGLDPLALTGDLVRLADDVDWVGRAAAEYGLDLDAELPAPAAPMLDLLSQAHARSEVRLFAS